MLLASYRETDANVYMLMTSMAQLGFLQNRYGNPDPTTFNKRQALGRTATNASGWMLANRVDADACSYAGSLLNMVDSMTSVLNDYGSQFGGSSFSSNLSTISTAYNAAIGLACEAGCSGASGSGCAFAAGSCSSCPDTLKSATSCTGATNDVNSCAAAGLVWFVNTQVGGWPGPL